MLPYSPKSLNQFGCVFTSKIEILITVSSTPSHQNTDFKKWGNSLKVYNLYWISHFLMLEFHKFNEYLIHFSKAFSKLIKEQRALSCICRLKQNPENVHFIFTDSWKAKYARPWVRATQRNEVSAQKEFTVQFIKCLFPIHPAWHLSCLVLVSRNNLT